MSSGSLAQLVEQRPEEPCVPSSSLGGATIPGSVVRTSWNSSLTFVKNAVLAVQLFNSSYLAKRSKSTLKNMLF